MTIYPSVEYTAIFYFYIFYYESTSSRACFDDNMTEGIENFTVVFNLSEYTLSLGVRLNQNSSAAIIYIEDNGESAGSHHWYAAFPGIQVVHVLRCKYVYVQLY